MKNFAYEARDVSSKKVIKATVQADSEHAAARLLTEQGLVPVDIREVGDGGNIFNRLSGRITVKDRVVFTRQLATLLGAGLPLSQSLHTVKEQTANKKLQGIVQDVVSSIEAGRTLSESFGKHTDVFDNVFLALVAAGEASGTLDESLQRIAAQQEKDAETMNKIKGAMMYPIIVMVVIMAVMGFMLFTVVPEVEKLYEDLNQVLPFLTASMVNVANFLISYWWAVLIVLGAAGYFFVQYLKTESGIKFMDGMKLNMPIIKGMFRKLYMARFSRTGETLLATGVPMLDTLRITANAVNNTYIKKSVDNAAEKVKGGKPLSESLKPEDYILPLVPQMISIGERSGKIDEMMSKTAGIYEDELDDEIRALSTAIEPLLMVVLAVVAGSMVGAILFPIYSLVNTIG